MNNNYINNILTICITSKGRNEDLNSTLRSLELGELCNCPIIIIDDGSESPVINPENYKLDIQFIRYLESKGLIPRRNELARLCKTRYLMSLDDDSAPISGSIIDTLAVFANDALVKTVALHIVPPVYDLNLIPEDDYETRLFTGCGHIHEVETFLELNGYSEHLIYGYEEVEYSLKLAEKGYKIFHKSDYTVVHNRSLVSRPNYYNSQCVINRGWVNGTYLGFISNIIEFYSLIKNHGIRNAGQVIPLYISGYKSKHKKKHLRLLKYLRWKRKKTPSIA